MPKCLAQPLLMWMGRQETWLKEDGHKNLNLGVKNHFFPDLLISHSLFSNTVIYKRLSVRSKDVAPSECRALQPGTGAHVYSSHFLGAVRTGVTPGVETGATGVKVRCKNRC